LHQIHQDQQLLALRDCFTQLQKAVTRSDLEMVERATSELYALLEGATQLDADAIRAQHALVEEVSALSAEVEALLASRLHAYDLAMSAWHKAEGVSHEP
jgi:hypothetical protein